VVEVDVVALADGTLALAHGRRAGDSPSTLAEAATLPEVLDLLAGTTVLLQVDLKGSGAERLLVEALRGAGAVDRTVVSSHASATLRSLAALEPRLALGLGYPHDRAGLSRRRLLSPVVAGALPALRAALPLRLDRLLAAAPVAVVMLHHEVAGPAAVARCHERGLAVWVWTVNTAAAIRAAWAAGVDGITTDDPVLFLSTLRP